MHCCWCRGSRPHRVCFVCDIPIDCRAGPERWLRMDKLRLDLLRFIYDRGHVLARCGGDTCGCGCWSRGVVGRPGVRLQPDLFFSLQALLPRVFEWPRRLVPVSRSCWGLTEQSVHRRASTPVGACRAYRAAGPPPGPEKRDKEQRPPEQATANTPGAQPPGPLPRPVRTIATSPPSQELPQTL